MIKHFHEFFTKFFFWQFFSWNQSCQQLKSPKPQPFHEFFTPKKIYNFLGKSKFLYKKWRFRTVCFNIFFLVNISIQFGFYFLQLCPKNRGFLTFLSIKFCSVPIHIILLIEHLQDLTLAERQLIVRRVCEVMFGHSLHCDQSQQLLRRPEFDTKQMMLKMRFCKR